MCSKTEPEESAAVILSELRTGIVRGRQPDLHGTVMLTRKGWEDREPLAGVGVTISAAADHVQYRATADATGRYAFDTLPPGTYSAAFDLPANTVLLDTNDKPPSVTIPLNDGTGMACHLSVVAGPSGGIRGHVVDAGGNPVEGGVYAYPKGEYRPEVVPDFSDYAEKGAFSLEHLPDGDYDLVFNSNRAKLHAMIQVSVHNGAVTNDVEVRLK